MEQPLKVQLLLVRRPADGIFNIIGGPTIDFYSRSCATTNVSPTQYVALWMLTFPVNQIFSSNIYNLVFLNLVDE